jgi:hypothetical protein
MFPALTLAAALALTPAQSSGKLTLANLRCTHGLIGPTRTAAKYLPGDIVYLGFDIDGVTIDKSGKVVYSMALEVTDKAGKVKHKVEPTERIDFAPLGGTKVPGVAFVVVGVDLEPGEYTVKLTATDTSVAEKEKRPSGSVEFKFEVLKPDLGIVMVHATTDPDGRTPTHTTGFVGQFLWVQFAATGFKRDPATKNPDLKFEMTTLDDKGTPTLGNPITLEAKALEEKYPTCQARMNVPLTRVGKFKVQLKVTDNVAQKSATFELPIQAVPVEK